MTTPNSLSAVPRQLRRQVEDDASANTGDTVKPCLAGRCIRTGIVGPMSGIEVDVWNRSSFCCLAFWLDS
jgi:hypothetical protein